MASTPTCNLRIPGPTPLPPRVRQAMAEQMISHRGADFEALYREVVQGLAPIYGTRGDVLLLTASGTGGLEASVVNTLSPGQKALVVTIGVFGDRVAEIAAAYGVPVTRLSFPLGQAAEPEAVREALRRDPELDVVFVTHNETSTGVTNDIAAIAAAVRSARDPAPLLVVDAVSSLGAIEMRMDEWGCDMVVTASQKACMTPPGLAMIGVGPRAWPWIERAKLPRFYFDLLAARKYAGRANTPYTPAVSALYGLRAGLELMREEGLEAIYARHRRLAAKTRAGLQALGLRLLADPAHASDTVTAAYVPEGCDGEALVERLAREHGLFVGEGQGKLKGKILRVAHMGCVDDRDIEEALVALERALAR